VENKINQTVDNSPSVTIINYMVEYKSEHRLNAVFRALADSTRRAILVQLAEKELTVNEIAAQHNMSLQAVSKHLKVLENAELIVKRKAGRIRRCRVNFETLERASRLIGQYRLFWERRLEALQLYITEQAQEERQMGEKEDTTVVVSKVFDADRDKLFRAFSDPELMRRWFFPGDEGWSADVTNDFKVGGQYRIDMHDAEGNTWSHWGKYREIDPPNKIVFTWNSDLVEKTEVSVEFRETAGGTEIILTHEFLPDEEQREEHRGGWNGCLRNLERAIQQSSADISQYMYVTYISTSPEKVWNALIDPKVTQKYWQHENVSDWKPGSKWEHRSCDKARTLKLVGKVLESAPPRRLVLTWAFPADEAREAKHSRVTFEIEPISEVVRLTVTHDQLEPGSEMLQGIMKGWPKVLSSLKSLLEMGRPLPELW
jgi:uncharacterized protein YndB with AHSA1/START domain/DNA-binding transcriptional ArsR family regulator